MLRTRHRFSLILTADVRFTVSISSRIKDIELNITITDFNRKYKHLSLLESIANFIHKIKKLKTCSAKANSGSYSWKEQRTYVYFLSMTLLEWLRSINRCWNRDKSTHVCRQSEGMHVLIRLTIAFELLELVNIHRMAERPQEWIHYGILSAALNYRKISSLIMWFGPKRALKMSPILWQYNFATCISSKFHRVENSPNCIMHVVAKTEKTNEL